MQKNEAWLTGTALEVWVREVKLLRGRNQEHYLWQRALEQARHVLGLPWGAPWGERGLATACELLAQAGATADVTWGGEAVIVDGVLVIYMENNGTWRRGERVSS